VVCLLPVRADTLWWHDIVLPHAAEVRYIRGRLPFGGMGNSAPFASAIVVFRSPRGDGDGVPGNAA
jgi:site-specific DNA-methyltransferase (adenine-specific)